MKYVKIVRQDQYTLKYYSLNVSRPDLVVEYIPGQFVESRKEDWGLLVYAVEDLKDFMETVFLEGISVVWFCEVDERMQLPEFRASTTYLWEFSDPDNIHFDCYWPKHTIMVNKVKLIRPVKWEDFNS